MATSLPDFSECRAGQSLPDKSHHISQDMSDQDVCFWENGYDFLVLLQRRRGVAVHREAIAVAAGCFTKKAKGCGERERVQKFSAAAVSQILQLSFDLE